MKRNLSPCFGALSFAAVLTLAIASPGWAYQDAAAGKALYQGFCVLCHGPAGQGSELGSTLISPSIARQSERELILIPLALSIPFHPKRSSDLRGSSTTA